MSRKLYKWGIDADEIVPGLYQGSAPKVGHQLREAGVGMLVLAAEEYQPAARLFPGLEVVHAPLWDRPEGLTAREWGIAFKAVEGVARALRRGQIVLVTCALGLNRSGLIVACALCRTTGCSGEFAVEVVKARREGGLLNRAFARGVSRIKGSAAADRRLLAKLQGQRQTP